MAPPQAQLHVMTNILTKYEHILAYRFKILPWWCCTMYKIVKVPWLLQIVSIKMAAQQANLCHDSHSYQIWTHLFIFGFRGAAFTMCHERLRLTFYTKYYTSNKRLIDWFIYCHFQQYFSYIMATSFSGGRSRSTQREPPTMGKQMVNFMTCGCESSAPLFVIYKAGCEPTPYWW